MPYRKKYGKRKRTKKNKRAYQSALSARSPFARTYRCPMRYSDLFTLDPNVGGAGTAVIFSLNGLYDPNITLAGHQPMGFDTLTTLYDHSQVIGVKWKITFSQTGNAFSDSAFVGTMVSDSNNLTYLQTDGWAKLSENPEVTTRMMGTRDGNRAVTTLYGKSNPNKFLGIRSGIVGNSRVINTSASNPSEQVYLGIFAAGADAVQNPSAIRVSVELVYETIWTEPKQLGQS